MKCLGCKIRGKKCCDHLGIGILLFRLGIAAVFIVHGWQKISNIQGVAGFFGSLGLGIFFVYLVTFVEFTGGIAMLVGVLTRVAGFALAVNMLFVIILVKGSLGFVGGYEFELLLLLVSLGLVFTGPGSYALQNLWSRRK